jgi:hypothetical protein
MFRIYPSAFTCRLGGGQCADRSDRSQSGTQAAGADPQENIRRFPVYHRYKVASDFVISNLLTFFIFGS